MRLRTALNGFKRRRGSRFPAERPTVTGAFSGHGDRLVYIDRDGSFRDHSAALSGLYGIDRSRFGIETGDEIRWFDDIEPVRQHYYRDTPLVETEYDAGAFTVHQYDLTLGRAHITHVELRGEVPADAHLTAFVTFAPEGRETQVGRLIHEREEGKVVEVFHREEHDYVAASTGIDSVRGQIPQRFDELLGDDAVEFPRRAERELYEDMHLSGDVVVSAPLERAGRAARATLVTQLSDHSETTREGAINDVEHAAVTHVTPEDLRVAARERVPISVPEETPRNSVVTADLRALSLLRAPSGARIAGPEFDPYYAYSGGYGYTWFRDDSEVTRYLHESADHFGLDCDAELAASVRFYLETQEDDGTWPHRAWAVDGSMAPGWAHGRVDGSDPAEYQADQTASVTTTLATLLRERPGALDEGVRREIRGTLADAVGALDDTLASDGLPVRCQNCWENMDGRFAHTAATYLAAYAAVARAPVDERLGAHASEQAARVLEGLDALWDPSREAYALRLDGDTLDSRLDSASFALVDAVVEYDALVDGVDEETLDRLSTHVETALDGLWRDPDGPVAGLVRFEEDSWRTAEQPGEKVWSVATAWGASAATGVGGLLREHGAEAAAESFFDRAGMLYELLLPDGPLCTDVGFLAEQVFDDGSLDSATPLGWSHALRLRLTALLDEHDALPAAATPEGPDDRPQWTTGEKYGVGTVPDHDAETPSKVWFTLTEGALTEVRFPRVDLMNLRTVDFLVVDADESSTYTARTFNESRLDDHAETLDRYCEPVSDDALSYRHTVRETGDGRGHQWSLSVEYAVDPEHDALLADVSFEAEDDNQYEVYAVADTALTNTGTTDRGYRLGSEGNYHLVARDASAYDQHTGSPLLTDEDGEPYSVALSMVAEGRFDWATADVAGSDGLSTLFSEGVRPAARPHADNANLVLVGRLGTGAHVADTIGIGFAEEANTAGALGEAEGALTRGYEAVRSAYVDAWRAFLEDRPLPDVVADDDELAAQYRTALMTLRAVEDKTFRGAGLASPSVPWGDAVYADQQKGYGYNFVWSRDLYQVFTVLNAVGDLEAAHDALAYIYEYQQDEQGFIPQNTYVDGKTRWGGEQMDNISFPQVMAYQLAQQEVTLADADYSYENVRRSADYVAHNGPATQQERWEEEAGFSPSSIAAEIAGLACAGSLAVDEGASGDALTWLALADEWQRRVDEWTATNSGTERFTQTPYFVRITRDGNPEVGHRRTLANHGPTLDEREIIDGGFLELVRLGIRPWDDEVVRNSLEVYDDTIRVDTPQGPAWYRYNGDGYGEVERDDEGAPWTVHDKGKGRLWPIFSGERGEYELRAGTDEGPLTPTNLLRTMARFANSGRMIPEQVWDHDHETAYDWRFGEGTGSATPLAWSMAGFVRLAHGIDAGRPIETPAVLEERYLEGERGAGPDLWVDIAFAGDTLVITGQTTGDAVAVKTHSGTAYVEPDDESFEVQVALAPGEDEVIVAAADDTDLERAATSIERLTV